MEAPAAETSALAGSTIVFVYNTGRYLLNMRESLIQALISQGARVIGAAPRDEAFPALQALGVETIDWNLVGHGMNPLKDWRSYRQLVRILERTRPDIVFNFTVKPVIYGSLAAQRAGCGKTFSMIPGRGYLFGEQRFRQRLFRRLVSPWYRCALRRNHRVFFQNADDRDHFVNSGLVAPAKAVVIDGSGVDTVRFAPRPGQAERASFLLVARLLKEKGIAEYAAAARLLKRDHPEARFYVLGPYSSAPTALRADAIERWQSEGLIEYLGEADDVRPHLARAMVFVLPSYYGEGLPRTALEAMAMGKPVITTDWPGCRESVEEGGNGFLVPVRDAAALAKAMLRFLEDPDLAARMGECSREMACSRFDVDRVNAAVIGHLSA